ncbi:hypothetical protein TWF481_001162 [Arthrobotrys musiformis]|uniref:Shugoshin C-terminal domain-containing protein n=1 Tax=Arthrobotrys musiformis TaxID=47236 RepID=A0AAV9WPR9_9PEZI
MGRYLPWRDGPADGSRPRKRLKAASSIDDLRAAAGLRNGRPGDGDEGRVREEEYMRPGIKNDDRYIMVEDELLQIAKSYTAKLHSAELSRLQAQISLRKSQKLAGSQHSQPRIPGSMPKKRQVVLQRRAHDAAIRKAAGQEVSAAEDTSSYNPKFSSQSLGRLMTTSAVRIDSTLPLPLTPNKTIKPPTRAAAGFTRASFKKPSSSQISPSQMRSSQIAKDLYNDIDEEDDEDLDLIPRRSRAIPIPPKMTPIDRPTSSYASDKRVPPSKHPLRSDDGYKLLSSSPQHLNKPSPISSSPPPPPSRIFPLPSAAKISSTSKSNPESPVTDSDSDNDYADAEQAARWRRRSLPKLPITSSSTVNPPPAMTSKPKHTVVLDSSDDEEYADAEQAARFRRRKYLAEAQKSGAKN